jgi:acetyl-CoA acetyltransferase
MSGKADDVYVVGVGMTRFGRHDDVADLDLAGGAVRTALGDAGVSWSDVDIAVGGTNGETKPDNLVASIGLTGLPFVTVRNGCATGGVAMLTAANALRSGGLDVAVVLGYDNHARGAFNSSPARYGLPDWYGETGMMVTTQYFAMKARRYLYDHAISEESLGRVSAKAFGNGSDHPLAWRRDPITVEQVMAADMVNPPLTRYMFCAPDAGAVALVLARGQRAFDMCDSPVRIASVALRGRRFGSFEVFSPWITPGEHLTPTVDAAAAAFAGAGISPSDVDVAQLQDTDSGAEIIHMAETGLCAHGEQEKLLADGATEVDGSLPVNTDGGLLANGEPVGASGLRQVHEVVRQLQGRALGRQVPGDPRVGFTHVYGAPGISACSVLVRD